MNHQTRLACASIGNEEVASSPTYPTCHTNRAPRYLSAWHAQLMLCNKKASARSLGDVLNLMLYGEFITLRTLA